MFLSFGNVPQDMQFFSGQVIAHGTYVWLVCCSISTGKWMFWGGGGVDGPSLDRFPANLVLIFQSVFESRRLACSAHKVRDDACRAGNAAEIFQTAEVESFRSQQCRRRGRLHSKRCLCVVKPFFNSFLQPGVVLIFRWNSSLAVLRQTVLRHPTALYKFLPFLVRYCIAGNFRQEFNFVAFVKAIFWLN